MRKILKTLKKIYTKQQFQPNILAIFLNPFYFSRKAIFAKLKTIGIYFSEKHILLNTILDIGCGQRPYENLFYTQRYIGLELDTPINRLTKKADIFYDGLILPFENDSIDCILNNQVLEHVQDADSLLEEMHRVLKNQGFLVLSVPFIWDEHEKPNDYRRYSSFGIKKTLEEHGFSIIQLHKCNNSFSLIFQLINAYFYKKLIKKNKYINLFFTTTIFAFFNIMGLIAQYIIPENDDMFLDMVILAKKA